MSDFLTIWLLQTDELPHRLLNQVPDVDPPLGPRLVMVAFIHPSSSLLEFAQKPIVNFARDCVLYLLPFIAEILERQFFVDLLGQGA